MYIWCFFIGILTEANFISIQERSQSGQDTQYSKETYDNIKSHVASYRPTYIRLIVQFTGNGDHASQPASHGILGSMICIFDKNSVSLRFIVRQPQCMLDYHDNCHKKSVSKNWDASVGGELEGKGREVNVATNVYGMTIITLLQIYTHDMCKNYTL